MNQRRPRHSFHRKETIEKEIMKAEPSPDTGHLSSAKGDGKDMERTEYVPAVMQRELRNRRTLKTMASKGAWKYLQKDMEFRGKKTRTVCLENQSGLGQITESRHWWGGSGCCCCQKEDYPARRDSFAAHKGSSPSNKISPAFSE